jgi:hypothetical protein
MKMNENLLERMSPHIVKMPIFRHQKSGKGIGFPAYYAHVKKIWNDCGEFRR